MIATKLKKLAARITTAEGDISAVHGQTIAEVIDFINKNLNVADDGTLVVSELLKPVVNLLSEPIEVTEADHTIDDTPMSFINIPTLGVEVGKKYKVAITYNGTQNEYSCTAQNIAVADGAIVLQPDNSQMPYMIFENTAVVVFDKVTFDLSSGNPMPSASTDYGTIQVAPASGDNKVLSLPFSIDSIVEVEASAGDSGLLSEPIEVAPNLDPTNSGSLTHFISNMDTIGLVDMKDYNITYTYKGTQYTQKAQAQLKDDGTILFEGYQEDGSTSDALVIDNSIIIQMSDKATIDTTTGSVTYSENSMAIMAYSMSGTGAFQTFEPITINSITEV